MTTEAPYTCECLVNDLVESTFTSENFCGQVTDAFQAELALEECGFTIEDD